MVEAADDVLYRALCSGLPEPHDQTSMARAYLAIFNRMTKPLQSAAGSASPAARDQPAPGRLARRKARVKSST